MSKTQESAFSLLSPPYRTLDSIDTLCDLTWPRPPSIGTALVWTLHEGSSTRHLEFAQTRPPGVALLMILPAAHTVSDSLDLLGVIESARPHTVLPFCPDPDEEELRNLLRRGPADLAVEFTDYLMWRGLPLDQETRQLLRRMVTYSSNLKTVNGLARSLYISRRALGRRFMSRGLPAPSRWLQFCRVLRAGILLQSTDKSLYEVAYHLGYPDGFALSNQMKRLTGFRPSTVRQLLGWEWLVEHWLNREEQEGNLSLGLSASSSVKRRRPLHSVP